MKSLLRQFLAVLLCFAPLSSSVAFPTVRFETNISVVRVNNVGNLSTFGAPSGATFTLLTNPGNYFSIQGTEIIAAPSTPPGQYSVTVQATGGGLVRPIKKIFVLAYNPALFRTVNTGETRTTTTGALRTIAQ